MEGVTGIAPHKGPNSHLLLAGSGLAVPHPLIPSLELFESAAHRCIVNARMARQSYEADIHDRVPRLSPSSRFLQISDLATARQLLTVPAEFLQIPSAELGASQINAALPK